MINGAFPFLSSVDGWMGNYLPLVVRLFLWGTAAGCTAVGLYFLASNQVAIRRLKAETRRLRQGIFDPQTSSAEFGRMIRRNLSASLALLAHVSGPAILSGVPVLVLAAWLDSTLGFVAPDSNLPVRLTLQPQGKELILSPCPTVACTQEIDGVRVHWNGKTELRVSVDSRNIYSGNPFAPPTPLIEQRQWWHAILENDIGHLDPQNRVSEIQIHLSRLKIFPNMPSWAAGWEMPFFLSVLLVALGTKFVFKIE
jgi:hypothetical protein